MNFQPTTQFTRFQQFCTALLCVVWIPVGACNGTDSIPTIQMTPTQRRDIDKSMAERGSLSVPKGESFNYPKFRSGQEGPSARGHAEAVGTDGARCTAEAGAGGSAWGTFQLGYGFDNVTGRPLAAVVKVKLSVEQSLSSAAASSDVGGSTAATGTVRFIMKDSFPGAILKEETLTSIDLDKGPDSGSTRKDLVFEAPLEPDRGYYLVVEGHAEVHADDSNSVKLLLEVTDVSFEISWNAVDAATRSGARGPADSSPEARAATVPFSSVAKDE